jgi:hypothetical protein
MTLLIILSILFGALMIGSIVLAIAKDGLYVLLIFLFFPLFMITLMNTLTYDQNSDVLLYENVELRKEYEITKQIPLEQRINLPIIDEVKSFNSLLKKTKEANKTSMFKDAIDDNIDSIKPIEL